MLDRREPWARLRESRSKPGSYPLDVLVGGPAPGDSPEYRKRVEIRDALKAAGHNAALSEELIRADQPDLDSLEDELLQADAANLIVVLYGNRGTQTEVDRLLIHRGKREELVDWGYAVCDPALRRHLDPELHAARSLPFCQMARARPQ